MEINEINSLECNNNPTSSLEVNNLTTSDETNVDETNSLSKQTTYSKNKRIHSTTLTVLTLMTVSVTAIAGGSFISNAFVGNDPVINNFANCYTLDGNNLTLNLDVTIDQTYLVIYLLQDGTSINENIINSTGTYEFTYTLQDEYTYQVTFETSNGFDYHKTLNQYTINVKGE